MPIALGYGPSLSPGRDHLPEHPASHPSCLMPRTLSCRHASLSSPEELLICGRVPAPALMVA